MVVASLAVRPGLRKVLAPTRRPSRTRLVDVASGRERRPAVELRVGRVALVGQEVIVDPDRVPAGRLGGEAGVAQVRPARPVDPERRTEPHVPYRRGVPLPLTRRRFNSRLFRWHAGARRPLLIRTAANPWEVLVAEVMSQQTGIERVGPMWRRFVDRWPTPGDLAGAGTQELLAAWAGLGYNRRALALREAARTIVAEHERPGARDRRAGWRRCRGSGRTPLGPWRRRRFGVPVAPLDVNVRRVVSRVLGVPASASGLQAAADDLVSRGQPGRWFDAVMDLAVGDVPAARPACDTCPLAPLCASRGVVVTVEPKHRGRTVPDRPRAGSAAVSSRRRPRLRRRRGSRCPTTSAIHDRDAIRAARSRSRARGVRRPPRRRGARPALTRSPAETPARPVGYASRAMPAPARPADARRRPAAARRRPVHLRDGPSRPSPALGRTGPRCPRSRPRR